MKFDNMAKWQKELKSFMGIKRGLILEGNILDEFYCEVDNAGQFLSLPVWERRKLQKQLRKLFLEMKMHASVSI